MTIELNELSLLKMHLLECDNIEVREYLYLTKFIEDEMSEDEKDELFLYYLNKGHSNGK